MISIEQLANAFLKCAVPDRLQALANSLAPRDLVTCGQSHLTPFFTAREREEAGCRHRLFFSQIEYCDNLVFRRRSALDKLGERLLDANRTIGQPNKITVIFGRRITKHYRGKLQTEIEDMNLPNPVIRSHYGNGFIKQYVRDHLTLRTETASNNVKDYGLNKAVENLPVLRETLSAINDNYLNVQQDILETFVDRAARVPSKELGGGGYPQTDHSRGYSPPRLLRAEFWLFVCSSVRGHHSEIMFGVLVVVFRGDQITALGFSLGQRQIPLIVSLRVVRVLRLCVANFRCPPL